jgi:uncharacterized RDD family membrane protein YckC
MRRLGAVLLEESLLSIALLVSFAIFAGVAGAGPNNNEAAGLAVLRVILGLAVLGAYAVWALSLFSRGQTPGKYLVGIRVIRLEGPKVAGFGTMFLRELVAKPLIGLIIGVVADLVGKPIIGVAAPASLGINLLADCWLLWDKDTQELWDKIAGTLVVNDRAGFMLSDR